MGNLRYEPWREGRVIPYVYAGIGYGQRTVELDLIPILLTFEDTKSDVVWHAGAGFDVKLAEHVKAGLRYEYFDGVDMGQAIGPVAWNADGQNHAVSAVLTFALN
jgi:opacity protein-like surface antigen